MLFMYLSVYDLMEINEKHIQFKIIVGMDGIYSVPCSRDLAAPYSIGQGDNIMPANGQDFSHLRIYACGL